MKVADFKVDDEGRPVQDIEIAPKESEDTGKYFVDVVQKLEGRTEAKTKILVEVSADDDEKPLTETVKEEEQDKELPTNSTESTEESNEDSSGKSETIVSDCKVTLSENKASVTILR